MYIEQFYIDIQVQYCGISDICGAQGFHGYTP